MLELYGRRFIGSRCGCEIAFLGETEYACEQVVRECTNLLVIVFYNIVEVTTGNADPVFSAFQLCLQFEEVLLAFNCGYCSTETKSRDSEPLN